ncbi:hypothetical protein FPQ18DRAFT_272007 [Pyronema domesticum]|uniref:Similar to Cyclic AMP receptor 2 acc. no. P34907 n=1 Tax=Pyronema omphalodes (strain CBS 100304) TaxID=1076935 RepID=U4LKF4_PYROM|nr:hypothetical protein FPQ18DRAFT_272007 [Pyronema domesticum]CCX32418.1 Similar to Cyclic AMP receptor 2; acc. no. P34907 [Pyronema omphalodes CBS 100304]
MTITAPFTNHQFDILEKTSRISSVFSLFGAGFIMITFCTSEKFRRPINRLAFYASFGNVLTNIATIYSRAGINAGRDSLLCQLQGGIIQWAIPADALFCLAMAFNVYLTVFHKRTSDQLKILEPLYVALCYGLPFIPSLTFLLINPARGKIYGPATLWCWIDNDWQVLRIASFYGPTWVVLALTFFIYLVAGKVIFTLRRNLRRVAKEGRVSSDVRSREPLAPLQMGKVIVSTIDTVEVSVTNASDDPLPPPPSPGLSIFPGIHRHISRSVLPEITSYTCHIEAVPHRPSVVPRPRNTAVEANTAAWAYCRCAMLFFLALIITWAPSSINRVYSLANDGQASFALNFGAVLVLPAQGFWNGLIYIVTTWPACKAYFHDIVDLFMQPVIWCQELKGFRKLAEKLPRKQVSKASLV